MAQKKTAHYLFEYPEALATEMELLAQQQEELFGLVEAYLGLPLDLQINYHLYATSQELEKVALKSLVDYENNCIHATLPLDDQMVALLIVRQTLGKQTPEWLAAGLALFLTKVAEPERLKQDVRELLIQDTYQPLNEILEGKGKLSIVASIEVAALTAFLIENFGFETYVAYYRNPNVANLKALYGLAPQQLEKRFLFTIYQEEMEL